MLKIYHANRLETLLQHLARELVDAPADPFQAEVILVQNPGMAHWLKLQVASMFSVAANIEFPLPSTFIWRVFRLLVPELPERSAFVKEAMTWKLMTVIPGQLDHPDFLALNNYLAGDSDGRKLFQLASKIADVYDQYLVYRPDWITLWEKDAYGVDDSTVDDSTVDDSTQILHSDQRWQPLLWRELLQCSRDLGQSTHHRASLFTDCARLLKTPKQDLAPLLAQLPERLFVFGITTLAPSYLAVLDALSEHLPVHLMLFNPCLHYWGDIIDPRYAAKMQALWLAHGQNKTLTSTGNPLLASMAQQGRDYLDLLHEYQAEDIDAFCAIEPLNLLSTLQSDVLFLQDRRRLTAGGNTDTDKTQDDVPDLRQVIGEDDQSVILHSCYSPVREVEALHDQLLALFDEDPQLGPKDIIVMMADVESYAPYIDAVFGNEGRIPWALSDRSSKAENPLINAFFSLLALPTSRFGLSEVLDLLTVPTIADRFFLNEQQRETVQRWLQQAGVRWGINGDAKRELQLPATGQNTWEFGLQRLLLGYAMQESQGIYCAADCLPLDAVEGQQAEILGHVLRFIDRLGAWRRLLNAARTATQWQSDLNQLLDEFFVTETDDIQSVQQIRSALSELCDQCKQAAYDSELSQTVLMAALKNIVDKQRGNQRFMAGQVNFCTLMPMRSIPFKVVCLLGMNDMDYPRNVQPIGFDLMVGNYRKGDRSRRDDDRYLFLEAILSARQTLVISYQGRGIRDNQACMPSVLVSELLDYCEHGFVLEGDEQLPLAQAANNIRKALIREHPLQAFNPGYFTGHNHLYSYSESWLKAARRLCETHLSEPQSSTVQSFCETSLQVTESVAPDVGVTVIELNSLIQFFLNPSRHFLVRRLGVYFASEDELPEDEEPFQLSALERYQLRQELLEAGLQEMDSRRVLDDLQCSGRLPFGGFGEQAIQTLSNDIVPMLERLRPLMQETFNSRDIYLEIDRFVITGRIRQLRGSGLLHYRPAEFKAKDRIRLWISHLALCAAGYTFDSQFIGQKKKYGLTALPQAQAFERLQQLLHLYQKGQTQPLAFFAETSYQAYTSRYTYGDDEQRRQRAMKTAYEGVASQQIPGEGSDVYIDRCFGRQADWPADFLDIARTVFGEFDQVLEEHS